MADRKKVSLTWQTVFAIVPIVNMFAAWRIEKLRIFLLINIIIIVGNVMTLEIIYPGVIFGDEEFSASADGIDFLFFIFGTILNVILIRRWSKDWNHKFFDDGDHDGDAVSNNDLFHRD